MMGILDDFLARSTGQKLAFLAGLLVAVIVLDWSYWYGPRAGTLGDLQSQVAAKRAELETKRNKTNARADSEKELRELTAELRRAEARLPDQREIADLLSSIAASGREAGLDITLFRQKPETYQDFYAEVPVQMEMHGTYHDVVTFLDRVKRLDRIVNVADIQLKKPSVNGDKVMLEAGCTATTFRFLDESERQRLNEQKKKQQGKPNVGKDT